MVTNLEFDRFRNTYSIADPDARKVTEDCPTADTLWNAAACELSLDQRRAVIAHTLLCHDCAESWRVAMRLGARPQTSLWARAEYFRILVCRQIWHDLQAPAKLAGRGTRWLRAAFATTGGAGSMPARIMAAATVAVAAGVVFMLASRQPVPDRPLSRGASTAVESRVPESLPRDRCVLRWSGPREARYDLWITTEDLTPVVSARNLAGTEYRIPEEELKDLEPGSVLLWQVNPLLPDDNPWDRKTFTVRIE